MSDMRKFAYILMLLCVSVGMQAQDKVEVDLGADIVNQFIWRGMDSGHASIQPFMGVNWKGLSVSAWGSVGFTDSDDAKELDLSVSYTAGPLTVGITDYWFDTPNPNYFVYKAHETSHVFEGSLSYDFNVLSLSWQTIFAGNDGCNNDGKRAYSSYVEVAVPFALGGLDWEGNIGLVPYATSFYETDGIALTNLSLKVTKAIPITEKFSLPIYGQLIANPYHKKAYFVFGLTLGI